MSMNKMNLFDSCSDIKTRLIEIVKPYNKDFYFAAMEPVFEKALDEGKDISKDPYLTLAKSCFAIDGESYDISYNYNRAITKLILEDGFYPEYLINLSYEAITALAETERFDKSLSKEVLAESAKILFSSTWEQQKKNRFLRAVAQYPYNTNTANALALCRYTEAIKDHMEAVTEWQSSGEYDACDIYSLAQLMNISLSKEEAERVLKPFIGKNYSFDLIQQLTGYDVYRQEVPACDDVTAAVLRNECLYEDKWHPLMEILQHVKTYATEPESAAYLSVIYEAGFSVSKLRKEGTPEPEELFKYFYHIAKVTTEWAKQNVSTLAGKAKYLADVVVGDHVFAVIKPELLFNALRVECNEYVPGKDKTAVEYLYPFRTAICNWITETAAYCTVTPAWSGNTARDLQRVIIDSDYVDVQILYNGIPVFHFPEDFFFEYYEEIEAWGREHRMPATVMTEGNSLLLSFSDVSSYTIQARKVPVSLSLDLKSKIRLLEENDCRYNMPIMKAKMLEYMRDNGKDPSVLDNVGLQIVITLVQVLLLQDTPEYKTLFQRDDSFLAGFNALKWMVRSDDNLYSAVMRYAFALTSIYNEYSNAKISETLQSYAIVNGTQMPILSVFSKNKSLLQFLQENKKSCKVNVEGDVMRIEKA